MKLIIKFILIFITFNVSAQELKTIQPIIGTQFDFSFEKQKEIERFEKLLSDLESKKKDWNNMSKEDNELFEKYGEVFEGMWAVGNTGCSWYCGAGNYSVNTSSELNSNGKYTYKSENIKDFSYQTAWVEGKKGYGIGEFIEFSFPPTHPRVSKIIIANGYIKSKKTWSNNSRVHKLKMYVNEKPYAIIELKDVYAEQSFELSTVLGYSDRENFDKLKEKDNWTIKFEILEVYKGDKYDDTAITEIYFDGLDVHCLAKGTLVSMADQTFKKIELLNIGDEIISYNQKTKKTENSVILELAKPIHKNLIKIDFSNGTSITCTRDHPFLTIYGNWASNNPKKTENDYEIDNVTKLEIDTKIKTLKEVIKVTKITDIVSEQKTYTIVKMNKNKAFIANGLITGIEEIRVLTKCISY